jgi:uncharacterized protein YfeS
VPHQDDVHDDLWELARATAHPAAAAAMSEAWYWDVTDELSPFGNDTGSDVLELFRQWRGESPDEPVGDFLAQLLEDWDIPDAGWDEMDVKLLGGLLAEDDYALNTRDDMIIALALAQLVIDGRIDAGIREKARLAARRQLLPVMLARWGRQSVTAAARYGHMLGVLERA